MRDMQILSLQNRILVPDVAKSTQTIEGQAELIQRVVKVLLTIPGSDIFDPDYGVGIQAMLPKLYDDRDLEKTKMTATEAILKAEKALKQEDAVASGLKPSEMLSSLHLRDLSYDVNNTQWVVDIVMKTMDGNLLSIGVGA